MESMTTDEKRMSDEQLEQYFKEYAELLVAKNPLWYIDRIDFRHKRKEEAPRELVAEV